MYNHTRVKGKEVREVVNCNKNQGPLRLRGPAGAKVIQVVETQAAIGDGTENDPVRLVIEYWSLDGKKLATNDPYLSDLIASASSNVSSDAT